MDDLTCLNNIKNMNHCTVFVLAGNKDYKKKGISSLFDTGEVMGQSGMMVAYCVSDCSSI